MNYNLINQLTQRDEAIERVKATCTPSEVAAIICKHVGHAVVKIPGPVDIEKISQFDLTAFQIGRLLLYANTIKSQGAKNKFDALSHAQEGIKEVTIGKEKIVFHEDEDKTINTYDGVVGGHSLGTLVAGAIGCTIRKIKDGDAKAVTYHAKNDIVMGDAKASLLSSVVTMTVNDVDTAAQVAKDIDSQGPQEQKGIITLLNTVVPTPILSKDGKRKPTALYKVRDLRKEGEVYKTYPNSTKLVPPPVSYHTRPFASSLVQGEFTQVAEECSKYYMGLSLPTLRRVGRNMWVGVPLRENSFEHVIALHDAGVPVGSRILVKTADMVMISLIRSNFGGKVWGIGSSTGMIPQASVGNYSFDYVYYPRPIVCGYTGSVDHQFSTAVDQLKSMLLPIKGKIVMHISPIFMYCYEFATFFGHAVGANDTKPLQKMSNVMRKDYVPSEQAYGPIDAAALINEPLLPIFSAEYEEEFKLYGERMLHKVPCAPVEQREDESAEGYNIRVARYKELRSQLVKVSKKSTERSEYHSSWGGIYDSFPEENTVYDALTYCQIKGTKTNFHPTQLSYQGTMLFVEDREGMVIEEALGYSLIMMRHCHKSAWVLTPVTKNQYRLRRIVKAAMLDQLVYDDEFSAIYSADARQELMELEQEILNGNVERAPVPVAQREEEDEEYNEGRQEEFDYGDG